jgi:protoporphyrin/coproporphyrin ferrochelatase
MKKYGIVLLQLGGPDSLDAVEPFLYNLFRDPDIINYPFSFLFRKRLARYIAKKRSPKIREHYHHMGGKSPILELTEAQGRALEEKLKETRPVKVVIAMRYWKPFTDEAIQQLKQKGITDVVLLPLYPHYSISTTGSSLNEWNRAVKRRQVGHWNVKIVREYPTHDDFIASFVDRINEALDRFPPDKRESVHLVFSAHGTPVKLVRKGDPYKFQIMDTVNAIMRQGMYKQNHTLCYQSRVGPEKWLEPFTDDTVERLAKESVKNMLIVPVAFVSEHIETLYELDVEVREIAEEHGVEQFEVMPALNDHPKYIDALADLTLSAITEKEHQSAHKTVRM